MLCCFSAWGGFDGATSAQYIVSKCLQIGGSWTRFPTSNSSVVQMVIYCCHLLLFVSIIVQ
jgi:hypothetical protein